jgi:plasmid stabilization system protein ParE
VKIIFHRHADVEFGAAAHWYGAQRAGLDDDFELEVFAALDVISSSPHAFRAWSDLPEVHVFTMDRFPFLIAYSLPDRATLLVLAVAHSSRKPGYWMSRV